MARKIYLLGPLVLNLVAISEAIQAISTEDPACLGTAKPNMHDPPSFAEIAKSRGSWRGFKYLDRQWLRHPQSDA